MLDKNSSPSRNNNYPKRYRKNNTFSNTEVHHTEVGEFQEGYFIMPDPYQEITNLKKQNQKAYSPSRRKQSDPVKIIPSPQKSVPTPLKNNEKDLSSTKTPPVPTTPLKNNEKDLSKSPNSELLSPSTFIKHDHSSHSANSTPTCGRWAGPAFGNAPHPSSLPLPDFPPFSTSSYQPSSHHPHAHGRSHSVDSSLSRHATMEHTSNSPPTHPVPHGPVAYSYPHSVPVMVPFIPAPNLAQLSTDLRRLLNIGDNETAVIA